MTKRKQSYGKHIAESQVVTTQAMRRRVRYGKHAYGGRPPNGTAGPTRPHNGTNDNTFGGANTEPEPSETLHMKGTASIEAKAAATDLPPVTTPITDPTPPEPTILDIFDNA